MTIERAFPLQGVIGVVANAPEEIDQAVEKKLSCVEIRADLLMSSGHSSNAVLSMISKAKTCGLATLYTLRHPSHGGAFEGSEEERVQLNRQAIDSGADIVDLEWKSEASEKIGKYDVPLILSHHDFNGMPDEKELLAQTLSMRAINPYAIKIVPTANTLDESVRMLRWAKDQTGTTRIGFAMSAIGSCSRILTIAHGAPITYATFGEVVAPGQVDIDELLNLYRASELNSHSQLVAVVSDNNNLATQVSNLNRQFDQQGENKVAIGFPISEAEQLRFFSEELNIESIVEAL